MSDNVLIYLYNNNKNNSVVYLILHVLHCIICFSIIFGGGGRGMFRCYLFDTLHNYAVPEVYISFKRFYLFPTAATSDNYNTLQFNQNMHA